MKFRDQKTGEVLDYATAHIAFCRRLAGRPPEYCDVFKASGGCGRCIDWVSAHKKEAADIMGYEYIQDEQENQTETTRSFILDEAKRCVCGDREQDYGSPERSFDAIASLWSDYINAKFGADLNMDGVDVSAMMVLFKMARVATGHGKKDNWVDAAGYAACGGEIEGGKTNDDQ